MKKTTGLLCAFAICVNQHIICYCMFAILVGGQRKNQQFHYADCNWCQKSNSCYCIFCDSSRGPMKKPTVLLCCLQRVSKNNAFISWLRFESGGNGKNNSFAMCVCNVWKLLKLIIACLQFLSGANEETICFISAKPLLLLRFCDFDRRATNKSNQFCRCFAIWWKTYVWLCFLQLTYKTSLFCIFATLIGGYRARATDFRSRGVSPA